jgi:hypothetical protein
MGGSFLIGDDAKQLVRVAIGTATDSVGFNRHWNPYRNTVATLSGWLKVSGPRLAQSLRRRQFTGNQPDAPRSLMNGVQERTAK